MKRWQDIIDRLKEEGDWEAAAALWDARQAATLADAEREAVERAAGFVEELAHPETSLTAATLRELMERLA